MGNQTTDQDHEASREDDRRTGEEVRQDRQMSRRGALGAMGALAILMGVPITAGARKVKPAPPEWLRQDSQYCNFVDPRRAPRVDIEQMMRIMKEFSQTQTEPDFSDCIHVIDPSRMVDLRGHTTMNPLLGHPDRRPIPMCTRTTA